MTRTALTVALLVAATSASGAVYKCTGPDGSLTFSDKPCPGQANEEVDVRSAEPTDRQREEASRVLERDRSMVEGSAARDRGDGPGAERSSRPSLSSGMTKAQVRERWGAPDFKSPTMWGYHDDPKATVTFDLNGMVTSAITGP